MYLQLITVPKSFGHNAWQSSGS